MTSAAEHHAHDGADLAELREEIDALKAIPHEQVVNPLPQSILEREPAPQPTDAIGTEKWDQPFAHEARED